MELSQGFPGYGGGQGGGYSGGGGYGGGYGGGQGPFAPSVVARYIDTNDPVYV